MLIGTLVLAASPLQGGKIAARERPLVITTEMPALGPNTFNRNIGACTYKDILYSTDKCQRTFYQSFRTDPSMSCRVRFEPLKKCFLKKMESCFKPFFQSMAQFKTIMTAYKQSMKTMREQSCGQKKYNITAFLKESVSGNKCSAGFQQKMDSCPSAFFKMFMKRPGDVRLCRVYRQHTQCMKNTIAKFCSFDFSKSNWIFDNSLNPFCNAKQLKEDGAKVRLRRHHWSPRGGDDKPQRVKDKAQDLDLDQDHHDHHLHFFPLLPIGL